MSSDQILLLAILAGAILATLTERLRADLVALMVMVALGATRILSPQDALSGFSQPAVVMIMAIFILAEGLRRSGATEHAGRIILRIAGNGEARLVAAVMLAGAFLSLFMNNIAAASILLPAASSAARRSGVSSSRLLLPLAFGTILGGMATLFTTANIVVGSLLRSEGIAGFGLLDFVPVGLPLLGAGVTYMVVWGRRRLAAQSPAERDRRSLGSREDLVEIYRLGERLFRARIPTGSTLIGKPLVRSGFRESFGITAVAIERGGRIMQSPAPETLILQGDVLILEGDVEDFRRRDVEPYLEILPTRDWRVRDLESAETIIVEAMLAPRSRLIGETLRGSHFRQKYGMTVLAIWRAGEQIRMGLGDVTFQFGDALLLQGPRHRLPILLLEPDLIVLTDAPTAPSSPARTWTALAIMVATLLLAAIRPELVAETMLGGSLAMVLLRMLDMDEAYRAIEWRSVILVAGTLPLGLALTRTGTAALFSNGLLGLLGAAGPFGVLAGLVVATVLLTQVISGPVVAAMMTPIAIGAAAEIGASPRSMAMGVALAASMAFATPLGHPVNVLVMGQGGYRFRDYARIGAPLTVLLTILLLALVPVLWPFGTLK